MNENNFSFELDNRGKSFCLRIARDMMNLFNISMPEAIGRINKQWKGLKIIGENLVYHRGSEEWAKIIYYEDGTFWWVKEWMDENEPKPKPYP